MPNPSKDLKATADLLDALQKDPKLLEDEDFIKRLSILRQKHEETTNFLAKKLGALPIVSRTTSSKFQNFQMTMTSSTSCHERILETQQEIRPQHRHEVRHEVQDHNHQNLGPQNRHNIRNDHLDHNVPRSSLLRPIRIAPPPPPPHPIQNQKDHMLQEDHHNQKSQQVHLRHYSHNHTLDYSQDTNHSHVPQEDQTKNQYSQQVHHRHVYDPSQDDHQKNMHQEDHSHRQVPLVPPTGPSRRDHTSSHRHVKKILETAHRRHNLATTNTAMPRGILLVNSNTKVMAPPLKGAEPPRRSKSMHNVSGEMMAVTVPKPFQLSLRKSIENTYAKKFMSDLITEKQKKEDLESENLRKNQKFKAAPVPKSTYSPNNVFATELKYIESMRKKVAAVARKKFEKQTELVRSKSEGNLAKPLGYVPPTTYISPIPVKTNARSRSATTRSAILIQEALTPKGIKSHRATSNMNHNLRHGKCKIDVSSVSQHRRMSPPDFQKIHAKINEEYRRTNSKPSTVPVPFSFAYRSQSAKSRHSNCKEKNLEFFKKDSKRILKNREISISTNHSAQLREELNRAKIQKLKNMENEKNDKSIWSDDNKKRISAFLGARSKTEEDIAERTKRKMQIQQETTQDYMRQLAEMKQRVLNGPLIMEKQTALAQEHRLKRKFEMRMKKKSENSNFSKIEESRRNSETSAAGTFVVEKSEKSESEDVTSSDSEDSDDDFEEESEKSKNSENGESENEESTSSEKSSD